METINSVGKCLFCGKEFAKAAITKHLKSHLIEKSKELKSGKSFHIKVELNSRESAPFFLNLWMDGNTTLDDLDYFLRGIWLECCGHLSKFEIKGQKRRCDFFDEDEEPGIPKATKLKDVFRKDLKLEYEYDFGSTTPLLITIADELPVSAQEDVILLSRNEPLEIMCDLCKKQPATQICSVCGFEDESIFCDSCAKKHAKKCSDFADYASMPVVNSPRMGECGYEGGIIDVERDGVFVKR